MGDGPEAVRKAEQELAAAAGGGASSSTRHQRRLGDVLESSSSSNDDELWEADVAAAAARWRQRQRRASSDHRLLLAGSEDDPSAYLRPEAYAPGKADVLPKQTLPNCTVCYGCTTRLQPMSEKSTFLGSEYINEKGATSSWLFRATTDRVPTGQAIVKVYCVPIPKVGGGSVPTCSPPGVLRQMQIFLALEKLAEDCGMTDIIPKVPQGARRGGRRRGRG